MLNFGASKLGAGWPGPWGPPGSASVCVGRGYSGPTFAKLPKSAKFTFSRGGGGGCTLDQLLPSCPNLLNLLLTYF